MKRNLFQTTISRNILKGILIIFMFVTSNECYGQIVRNGSFENHLPDVYPDGLTNSDNYLSNQFMKCIGYCSMYVPFKWNPVDNPMLCDFNQDNDTGGWYWGTNLAS